MWDQSLADDEPQRTDDVHVLRPNKRHANGCPRVERFDPGSVCSCLVQVFQPDAGVALEDRPACLQPPETAVLQGKRHGGTQRLGSF